MDRDPIQIHENENERTSIAKLSGLGQTPDLDITHTYKQTNTQEKVSPQTPFPELGLKTLKQKKRSTLSLPFQHSGLQPSDNTMM